MLPDRKTRSKKICKISDFYKIFSNLFIFLRPEKKYFQQKETLIQ